MKPTFDIALVGYMRSGKDSVAACLRSLFPETMRRISFADALKEEVARALNTVNISAAISPQTFDDNRPLYRPLLQWWGTEYRRAQDPDYWVRVVRGKLDDAQAYRTSDDLHFVCTDGRFENELSMLREKGFKIVELRMDQQEVYEYLRSQGLSQEQARNQLNHQSEVEWQNIRKDISFHSTIGNLPRLTVEVLAYLTGEKPSPEVRGQIAEFYAKMYPKAYALPAEPEVQS